MKKNMGKADRLVRIIIGIALLAFGLIYQQWWGILGLIFVATSSVSICPLYTLLGIKTCKTC